ncbi:E2F-associated phosphoprotein [Tribonema minus]|uniref:E2F-associated phosphoprotein n=1 Tax=Tribonema minus TaxID=303371 RepID=A0A836CF92_9STRA|nr:E2F-associated phosphoprotein [Tribonema minus]
MTRTLTLAPSCPRRDPELYDKDLDDQDEVFVQAHYRGVPKSKPVPPQRHAQRQEGQHGEDKAQPSRFKSDAHLSCPACFDSVCLECQRHARYANQYRAMLVMNVTVDTDQVLVPRQQQQQQQQQQRQQPSGGYGAPPQEALHPVRCAGCGAELGVYEADEELYHFFNVIATS